MLFPVLEIEKAVQVNDKTRLSASKSFVSKGATAISTLTIKPGADETAISVFSTDPKNWYLDWQFSAFKLDVDTTNNKIDFKEGGTLFAATVASGTYTLSTIGAALKTALEAAGDGTYTITVNSYQEATVTSDVGFGFLPETGVNHETSILQILGFKKDSTSITTSQKGIVIDGLTRKITLTAGDGTSTSAQSQYIKVFSETGDALFSGDPDLTSHKPDVLQYVPVGRSSFKNIHRRAQDLILAWLDEQGYTNIYNEKFTKFDIVDKEEVRQWSTMMCLKLIYRGLSNAIDDVFAEDSKEFAKLESIHKNRAILRIDVDKDKKVDTFEQTNISTGTLVRR